MQVTKEQIQQARATNISEYLKNKGEQLKRNGTRYRDIEHESLVFTENAYFHNSTGEHGNAIDYLVEYLGMDFKSAVLELIGIKGIVAESSQEKHNTFKINDITLTTDMKRTIAYLNKTRGISYSLIQKLIGNKMLFQEEKTNNIVFPMYDEHGSIVGAETCGTLTDKRYKGIKSNSAYGYGYNVRYRNEFEYALFFESAIELISFIDLKKRQNKKIENSLLVSLSGLKPNVVEHTLKIYKPEIAYICSNNDKASKNFMNELVNRKIVFKKYLPSNKFKDWNDELRATEKAIE